MDAPYLIPTTIPGSEEMFDSTDKRLAGAALKLIALPVMVSSFQSSLKVDRYQDA